MAKSAGIPAGVRESNQQAINQYADKKIGAVEKTIAELSEKLQDLQNIKEEIGAINEKLNSQGRDFAKEAQKNNYAGAEESGALFKNDKITCSG